MLGLDMLESLLFSTSSCIHLTQGILDRVLHLRPAFYRLGSFIDTEIMFYLDEPVKNTPCFVLGHTGPSSESLLQTLTIINTLKINGAKPIIAVIPYLGYARSDRDKPFQPINSRLFSQVLKLAGVSKIICLDLHSHKNEEYFSFPHLHLSALPLIAEEIANLHLKRLSVATPDKGGTDRAKHFASSIGIKDIIHIEKYRPSDTMAEVIKVEGDVNHRQVVLVDDMIETGHTLIAAAEALKKKGAQEIYAAVTHAVPQAKGINLLTTTSIFKKIYITNSLTQPINLSTRVSILDISPLLATAINKEIQQLK